MQQLKVMLSFSLPSRSWMETVLYWTELYQGETCPWIEGKADPFGFRLSLDDFRRLKATEAVMALALKICKGVFQQPKDLSIGKLSDTFGFTSEVAELMYNSWHSQSEHNRMPALARFDLAYDWINGSVKVLELNGHAAGWIYEAVDRQADSSMAFQDSIPGTPMLNLMEDLVNLLAQRGVTQDNPLWIVSPGGPEAEDDCFLVDALNANGSWARIATFENIHFSPDGATLMAGDEKLTGTVMLNSLYFKVVTMEQEEGLHFKSSPLLALFTSDQIQMLDPLWVMLLENKALLKLLWDDGQESGCADMLLETVLLPDATSRFSQEPCIVKPCQECNAFGVEVLEHGAADRTWDQPVVVQSLVTLPKVGDRSVITHAWFVGGKFSQPSFIAQDQLVSDNSSAMVPCWFG